ncbi:MAG: M1 family metallopeptidase [Chitinophagales bacterium]
MNKITYFLLAIMLLSACKTAQKAGSTKEFLDEKDKMLDEIVIERERTPYRATYERKNDLLHTDLDVSFDWQKQYLFGKATLTFKPYFYATNRLVLDAKGMDINSITLSNGTALDYMYNQEQITINLDKIYHRNEEYTILIDYISKPNELENKTEELSAIKDDKGLYFINPLGEQKDVPKQIWTQGETESNSVWFPTIDKPNERTTQEISITVDKKYIAMSNGYMVSDIDNNDGTRTITWKQDKPHAPYLFMMAIGEYAQVKDEWNGLSVDYFVEEEYKDVARKIFGKTPKMLDFFTQVLDVDYEWDKYWQVCVREYVSGAMENTSAVVFGDFVQLTEKELNDDTFTEDIVSHELFHHWFGDLVTCESWSNLPLNESFATYGEVLWREHEYGENEKYRKLYEDMRGYFNEASKGKQVDLIRFHYSKADDMFDSHSYAKGGVILNMLREVVGDEAFFLSLKKYLEDNKFQSVEIHNLRLAFEAVTGRDLNWFFNQWFLSAGHPVIDINYTYTDSNVVVKMTQKPSAEDYLVYNLPMEVIIFKADGSSETKNIVFDTKEQEFEFPTNGEAAWVDVDAKKVTLAEINNNQTEQHWAKQYELGKTMLDRFYAVQHFADNNTTEIAKKTLTKALEDNYWMVQKEAVASIDLTSENSELALQKTQQLGNDATVNTDLRAEALYALSDLEDKKYEATFDKAITANSFNVNAAGLHGLASINETKALAEAQKFETEKSYATADAIGYIYSEYGEADKAPYFTDLMINDSDQYKRMYAAYYYSKLLSRMNSQMALDGINKIVDYGNNDKGDHAKNVAINSLMNIQSTFNTKAEEVRAETHEKGLSSAQKLALENEMVDYKSVADKATEEIKKLYAKK